MNFDKEFDASGLACPLPIVKTKKALNDMSSGQVLRVVATDPVRAPTWRPLPIRPATSCSSKARRTRSSSSS